MPFLAQLKSRCVGAGLAAWLLLADYRPLRAETAATYKYEDYREAGGRIAVQTQSAMIEQDLGSDMRAKVTGVVDAIAGATPNGQPAPAGSGQVVLAEMHDRRKAWTAEFTRQAAWLEFDLGVANSRESDYASTGWSLNALASFNRKNTTLRIGIAGTDDDVKVFFQPDWAQKRTSDFIAGFTQLLDSNTMITADAGAGRSTGYLGDPYKLVQKSVEVAPGLFLPFTYGENRPDWREKWTFRLALNHAITDLRAALEASYRYYHDSFGTDAHTLGLTWLQRVGPDIILQPELRLYRQSAADFYHYQLDATSITPTGLPQPHGPFYSSDYRLSSLTTSTVSFKVSWRISAHMTLDVALERYAMGGRDGVTPGSAYPRAKVLTGGVRLSW